MSTFNGLVPEFPDIRIDFFRNHPNQQPPLACFLSHVHSDHLVGLETLRSPFVYCSAATREILLRLERCQCRLNYAQRTLEARQQTYKHLSKVLKPLPLEAPTILELQPGRHIKVTLFDANHCPGAVMFLVEGDGKAIMYTGDVRCEPWFVNSLSRNPNIIEYSHGIKRLDNLYLDTSFTRNVPFQTKAQGIADLLRQVSQYPDDTVFYVQSWTYGYEDVWIALSKALNSPIHVDEYKYRVYSSLRARSSGSKFSGDIHLASIAPSLTGFMCGNTSQPGCLTRDEKVRLHSCESRNMCEVAKQKSVVRIQPIVARLPSGEAMLESGIGGGGEDLEPEVKLGHISPSDLDLLLEMICSSTDPSEVTRKKALENLQSAVSSGRNISLNIRMSDLQEDSPEDLLKGLASVIRKSIGTKRGQEVPEDPSRTALPNIITFPYSRHSSYSELCDLVNVFKPKDVWPCTVDAEKWMERSMTIRSLFGEYCSGDVFKHDLEMEALSETLERARQGAREGSQTLETQRSREASPPLAQISSSDGISAVIEPTGDFQEHESEEGPSDKKRKADSFEGNRTPDEGEGSQGDSQGTERSFESALSLRHSWQRRQAYEIMLQNSRGEDWRAIELMSTDCGHDTEEVEL